MSFQIHSPEGIAIDLNELDKEACELWGVEHGRVNYAHPNLESTWTNSWFDSIGWAIHHPESQFTEGWNNVKCTLWIIQAREFYKFINPKDRKLETSVAENAVFLERLQTTEEFLKPYFDLIDHWESKGYIPVQIKENL